MSDKHRLGDPVRLLAPILLVLTVAGGIVWSQRPDNAPQVPNSIDVSATEPTFDSILDLRQASELIVIGVVEDEHEGRLITDPNDPTAGIRTHIYSITVEQVLIGDSLGQLTIEHEFSLLDHTPIAVNSVGPPRVGERAIFFLLAGPTDDFPHFALVNSQARIPIVDSVAAALGTDQLSRSIDGQSIDDIARIVTS